MDTLLRKAHAAIVPILNGLILGYLKMTDLRKNYCPVCTRLLGEGDGPLQVKCNKCKAVVLIEPNRLVVLQLPKFDVYKMCLALGITTYAYDKLTNLEIRV